MSHQKVTLKQLAEEAVRQKRLLDGREWDQALHVQAMGVAQTYAKRLHTLWGIEMLSSVEYHYETGVVEIRVTPATDLDEMMLQRLMEQEGVTL